MNFVSKLLHTPTGKILLSIILGLGIASLFRTVCKGRSCVEYYAPSLEEMRDKVFKYDGKCYTYEPEQKNCDKTKEILVFK